MIFDKNFVCSGHSENQYSDSREPVNAVIPKFLATLRFLLPINIGLSPSYWAERDVELLETI